MNKDMNEVYLYLPKLPVECPRYWTVDGMWHIYCLL